MFEGGATIIDYRLYYDDATGNVDSVFAEVVSGTTYTATGLTRGNVYSFKIEARNLQGYGFLSSVVSILAAQIPA